MNNSIYEIKELASETKTIPKVDKLVKEAITPGRGLCCAPPPKFSHFPPSSARGDFPVGVPPGDCGVSTTTAFSCFFLPTINSPPVIS